MENIQIKRNTKGFTLLEILLVIAAIGILAAIVLIAINPNKQLAQARDSARQSDINTIQKALDQYLIDTGAYPVSVSSTPGYICNTGTEQVGGGTNCSGRIDLRVLVPTYIAAIPRDTQSTGTSTGYNAVINLSNNKITVTADLAERKSIAINALNPSIVTSGLVLNLDAGNTASYPGSGTTWTDLSGNGNNGTLINGVGYNSANGGSLVFDGIDDYVQTPLAGTYSQITFEFWGFFDDPTLNTTSRNESAFGDWTSNAVHFGTRWSVGQHWNVNTGWINIPNSNLRYGWNHYALTWSGPTSQKQVYINGILSSTQVISGNIIIGNFRIGVATSLNAYYRGNISNFRTYSRFLAAPEIQQNYNALRGRYGL